jgi:hypothetical protein
MGIVKPIDLVQNFPYSHTLAWIRFGSRLYYDEIVDYEFL